MRGRRSLGMVCMWRRAGSPPRWAGLAKTFRDPSNRRLAKHLRHEEPWLFTFLHCPGIEATNNAAERALRPAVVARKTWGGNRTENGAKTQQILISIITTCRQQGRDSFDQITDLFLSPT